MKQARLLTAEEGRLLAATLGDPPGLTLTTAALLQGRCRVVAIGEPPAYDAVVVQDGDQPAEPTAIGDPHAILALLAHVEGWSCVNVDAAIAEELARLIEIDRGGAVRRYGDLHYILDRPPADAEAAGVELVDGRTLADLPGFLEVFAFGDADATEAHAQRVLGGEVAAVAWREGRVVAEAHSYAWTPRFADIGVNTAEAHRGRGLATAAAARVAQALFQRNLTPVWSTGDDNWPSQRVAAKLGFRPASRRVYLIPQTAA